jgi:hypothetical protein
MFSKFDAVPFEAWRSAHVRFGSKADFVHRYHDVRFTPESGHKSG